MNKKILPLIFLLAFSVVALIQFPAAHASATIVQAKRCATGTTCAFTSNIGSGSLIVTTGCTYHVVLNTPSDTRSTSFTLAVSQIDAPDASHQMSCYIWYGTSGSSGADTVTMTNTAFGFAIFEVTGLSGFTLATGTGTANCAGTCTPVNGQATTSSVTFDSSTAFFLVAPMLLFTSGVTCCGSTDASFSKATDSLITQIIYTASGETSPSVFTQGWGTNNADAWNEVSAAFFIQSTVVLPVKCTMDNGATQATLTISGGSPSPSPSTVLCDGSAHNITVAPSTTITFTEPADGGNTRDRFSGGGTTTTHASCASGTCSEFDVTNFEELQNTYAMTPSTPSTWDAAYSEAIISTVAGAAGTTICTVSLSNGGGSANCSGWADYNRDVTVPAAFASSVAGTWTASDTHIFDDTTGGNTHTTHYNLLLSFTITCTMQNGAAPVTPTLSGGSISPGTVSCDGSSHSFTGANGATLTATEPADSPPVRDRFNVAGSPTTTTTHTCCSAWAFSNWEQLNNTYSVIPIVHTTNKWDGVFTFTVTGSNVGVSGTRCSLVTSNGGGVASCHPYIDYNTAVTMTPLTVAPSGTERWLTLGTGSFTDITGGNTESLTYFDQISNTYQATPTTPNTWDGGFSIPAVGTYFGSGSSTICTITTIVGGGMAACTGYSDKNLSVSEFSFSNWAAQAPNAFTDDPGGNTHNVNFVQSQTTMTTTVVGWLSPDTNHLDYSIFALLFPMIGVAIFEGIVLKVGYRGDFNVTMILMGQLAGSVMSMLGVTPASTNAFPFALLLIPGIALGIWLWESGVGG